MTIDGGGFANGKLFILKDGKPQFVKVKTGLTDGKSTEVVSQDLTIDTKVIVGDKSSEASTGAAGNMRPPRMF